MNNLGMLLWNQGQLDEAGPKSLGCREVAFMEDCSQGITGVFCCFTRGFDFFLPILLDYVLFLGELGKANICKFTYVNESRTLLHRCVTLIHATVSLIAEIDNLPSLSDLYGTLHPIP